MAEEADCPRESKTLLLLLLLSPAENVDKGRTRINAAAAAVAKSDYALFDKVGSRICWETSVINGQDKRNRLDLTCKRRHEEVEKKIIIILCLCQKLLRRRRTTPIKTNGYEKIKNKKKKKKKEEEERWTLIDQGMKERET